jgi:hypothetical protein
MMMDFGANLLERLQAEKSKYADDPRMLKHITRTYTRIVEMRIAEKRKKRTRMKKRKAQKQARRRSR